MTFYLVLGLIIVSGLYLLYSNKSKRVNIESKSDQKVHDHNSNLNHSGHKHKKGHGCC